MNRLSDLFRESSGAPILWHGQQVRMMFERASSETSLDLRLEWLSPPGDQGVVLKASRGGMLSINGMEAPSHVLWSNSAPAHVCANVSWGNRGDNHVRIWNVWRDQSGVEQAWIGDSGILVDSVSDDEILLRCSNGVHPPAFDDLVVRIVFLS
jgi:hypothetical protein